MPDFLNYELGDDVTIIIPQGVYRLWRTWITYKDDDPLPNTVHRQSLLGFDGRGQVRKLHNLTSDLILDFEVVISQEEDVDNPDCGKVEWFVGAIESGKMIQKGYFNVELFDPFNLNNVSRIIQGPALKNLDVTSP